MHVQRWWRVSSAAAIALAGLISLGVSAVRAADLRQYISPDFCAAVVIHPEQIGKSTLAEAIKSAVPQQAAGDPAATVATMLKTQKNLPTGMDVDKLAKLVPWNSIHRAVLFVDSTMAKNTQGSAVIVQFSSDIDGDGIIAALTTDQQPAEANGIKYAKLKGKPGDTDGAALSPDNRTLILGEESTVVKMLAKNEGDRPLLKQLQRASLKHDILIEFYAEPLRAGLAKAKATGESSDGLSLALISLSKATESLTIKLNFSGKSLLHGELTSDKPETAAMLVTMGKGQVDGVKKQFEALKKNPPPGTPPALVPALSKLGDEVFAGLEIKSEGPKLTVELPMPDSLPDAMKAVAKIAAAFMPAPGPGAGK